MSIKKYTINKVKFIQVVNVLNKHKSYQLIVQNLNYLCVFEKLSQNLGHNFKVLGSFLMKSKVQGGK